MQRKLSLRSILASSAVVAGLFATGTALAQTAPAEPAVFMASAEAAFKRADVDGDNKLSKAEAEALPAIASRFAELDKDKDSFLSMSEFLSAFAPRQ